MHLYTQPSRMHEELCQRSVIEGEGGGEEATEKDVLSPAHTTLCSIDVNGKKISKM